MPEHPSTIDRLVRLRAAQCAFKHAVIDSTARISYRELDATTRELAAVLVDAGVGKGTRVGLLMPNCVRWLQIAVALTRIGAVLVPISTLLAAPELNAHLRVASVQFLISVDEFRGRRYLDDLEDEVGSPTACSAARLDCGPTITDTCWADRRRDRRCAYRNRDAQRSPRDHVHVR
jgi:acyl-CoA synthetase (AMP-forming)/AMP-acid ligase II